MSTSRLEKFIYAICSMEVSDLPAPLSRIEILWNCLITGETPDFEPQSRNEKYLMAMMNHYDISNLPAPMSRGEKLLYKIAMGETDLSDVPGYLSRYEELLKYLIENGGIGDFEYVLYTLNQSLSTLYQTVEKPVKSAILKGQTLVNITSNKKLVGSSYIRVEVDNNLIKPNEQYTLIVNGYSNVSLISCVDNNGLNDYFNIANPKQRNIFTTPNNLTNHHIRVYGKSVDDTLLNSIDIILIEGDYTNINIPYFEGMQSVKLPVLTVTNGNLLILSPNTLEMGSISGTTGGVVQGNTRCHTTNIKVSQKDDLFLKRINCNYQVAVRYYYGDTLVNKSLNNNGSFIVDGNLKVNGGEDYDSIKLIFAKSDNSILTIEEVAKQQIMLVPNNNYTTYEPHKTNILTVNEDVELGSVGEVKDELNLLTGQLTQRTETRAYQEGDESNSEVITDMTNTRYKLPKEVIKTVDLTTVDQDGQPTKLKTFNDITHVEINSDNMIPSVDVEVATKISETLATLDPQQLDISNTQNKLGQTIDEQTENTDATMMATTEIYEQTL